MNRILLNELLLKHKAQTVGNGDIDIIVSRKNYKEFVADILKNEYIITGISWWEFCHANNKNQYGLGGPKSNYYNGWFSELPIDIDEIKLGTENQFEKIVNVIEQKIIHYPNETITFDKSAWLTPAFWLDVPEAEN